MFIQSTGTRQSTYLRFEAFFSVPKQFFPGARHKLITNREVKQMDKGIYFACWMPSCYLALSFGPVYLISLDATTSFSYNPLSNSFPSFLFQLFPLHSFTTNSPLSFSNLFSTSLSLHLNYSPSFSVSFCSHSCPYFPQLLFVSLYTPPLPQVILLLQSLLLS